MTGLHGQVKIPGQTDVLRTVDVTLQLDHQTVLPARQDATAESQQRAF